MSYVGCIIEGGMYVVVVDVTGRYQGYRVNESSATAVVAIVRVEYYGKVIEPCRSKRLLDYR